MKWTASSTLRSRPPQLSFRSVCLNPCRACRCFRRARRGEYMKHFAVLLLAASAGYPQSSVNDRPSLVLETKSAKVVVDLGGGSIRDFHLAGQTLNPLTWDSKGDPASP